VCGVDAIAEARCRTAVACVLGRRAFVGTWLAGQVIGTRRCELSQLNDLAELSGDVRSFPAADVGHLRHAEVEELRAMWSAPASPTAHVIIEGGVVDAGALPRSVEVHVADPDRSFASICLERLAAAPSRRAESRS